MMRKRVSVVLFCCAVALCCVAQRHPQPMEVKTFELYSWQGAKGGWSFSLFPAISNAGLHPNVIMRKSSALIGQENLRRAIAELPSGSEILWLDHSIGMWKDAKGWELIKYPPPEIIEDTRKYCEEKGMKLSVEKSKDRIPNRYGNLSR